MSAPSPAARPKAFRKVNAPPVALSLRPLKKVPILPSPSLSGENALANSSFLLSHYNTFAATICCKFPEMSVVPAK